MLATHRVRDADLNNRSALHVLRQTSACEGSTGSRPRQSLGPEAGGSSGLLEALFLRRLRRQLCSVPACDHPEGPALTTVKKTIGRNNHFTKGEIRKLWNESTGLGISREPSECVLSSLPEFDGCLRIVPQNIGHRLEKLDSSGGCEAEFHFGPLARRPSASAKTSSRPNPFPTVISCSPRARRCRSWRSCSLRS